MRFFYSSLVKRLSAEVVAAQDAHVAAGGEESAAALVAAHDALRRVLTEQVAVIMKTATPKRAEIVTSAAAQFVRRARRYADRVAQRAADAERAERFGK